MEVMPLRSAIKGHFATIFKRGGYARDAAINTFGVAIAAAVPLITLPVIARLYSPADFGVFGVFSSFVGLSAVVATGRYEAAIILPEEKLGALETAFAASMFSLGVSIIFLIGLLLALVMQISFLQEHYWLGLIAIFTMVAAATVQILLNCAIRERMFSWMSLARGAGACITAISTVALGVMKFEIWGLVLGLIAGYLTTIVILSWMILKVYLPDIVYVTFSGIRIHAMRYRQFPFFSLPSDFANTLATNLPILFFSTFFGSVSTGYLTMFQRIWAGSGILIQGLGETFRERAASELKLLGNFRRVYRITLIPLASVAAVLLVALVSSGPMLFAIVMGEQWRESGEYGRILALLVCTQFVASPLSWSFYIAERLKLMMVWQWSLLAIFFLILWVGSHRFNETTTLALLAGVGTAMYLVYLFASFWISGGKGIRAQ